MSFEIDDSNVLIYLNNDRAQGIKILSQIGGQGWPVESIEFADGSVLKLTSMMSHLAYRQTDKTILYMVHPMEKQYMATKGMIPFIHMRVMMSLLVEKVMMPYMEVLATIPIFIT